jgi:hypothetical protein
MQGIHIIINYGHTFMSSIHFLAKYIDDQSFKR